MQTRESGIRRSNPFHSSDWTDQLEPVSGRVLISGRTNVAGSVIGGITETRRVIDYAARKVKADIELIGPDQIGRAYDRVVNKDVRHRFVVDMTSSKEAG